MARRNIFEILQENIDFDYEVSRIMDLWDESSVEEPFMKYTLDEFIDEFCLEKWKNRNRCTSCQELCERLDIEFVDSDDIEQVIRYLEYISNMVWLIDRYINAQRSYVCSKEYKYMKENVSYLIDLLNYEAKIIDSEEKVILIEKNPAVTAVAEIVSEEVAIDIIEYNHYMLKGDISKKRKILKVLADKFEAIRPELKKTNSELESSIGLLINKMNIRHNNVEGKNAIEYVKKLSTEELEGWYDEIYQMILLAILEFDNIERNKKVEELKKNLN